MPNPNSSVITDYAPPVIRAPSPPSSVGSDKILLPDLPDPDKDLTPAELERKIEESLGLHRQRHEEILAEEDPLIPKPKNEEEANGMSWQQASMISISSAARDNLLTPNFLPIPCRRGNTLSFLLIFKRNIRALKINKQISHLSGDLLVFVRSPAGSGICSPAPRMAR